ncbi:uncharacterized protein G2W53_032426 [Senna tora]|uniref:Uncharacterized protein n=1 Tax=Senna tora TaxID=362788 RepID=A0A834SWC1_9FABA|nr:uncharacterized protein G2W53_032426 [Senna tora]
MPHKYGQLGTVLPGQTVGDMAYAWLDSLGKQVKLLILTLRAWVKIQGSGNVGSRYSRSFKKED